MYTCCKDIPPRSHRHNITYIYVATWNMEEIVLGFMVLLNTENNRNIPTYYEMQKNDKV